MMPENINWSPGVTLDAIEKMVILKALYHFKYNKTVTASSLGIAIRTLDNKLEKYEYEKIVEEERQANALRQRTDFLAKQRGNPPNNIGVPFSPGSQPPQIADLQRHFSNPSSGPRMESFANASEKSPMPVQERSEVQTVLSKSSSPGGKNRGR